MAESYKLALVVGAALDASFRATFRTAGSELNAFNRKSTDAVRKANQDITRSTSDSVKQVQKTTKQSSSAIDEVGRSIRRLGTYGLGAALAGGLIQGTRAAVEFDRNMRNVTSLIAGSGATTQQAQQYYDSFSKSVLQLSKTVPQSANQLAEGLYEVISNGVAAADAIQVLGVASRAASAGLSTTEVAVDGITGVMNAYGYSAQQAQAVSDVLFQTVNVGRFTFTQLAQQIGDVTASASAARIPIQDVGAALATMTQGGIVPAESVTSLNRIIIGLINPTTSLSKALKDMGYDSGQAALDALGLKGVIEGVGKVTGGTTTGILNLFSDVRAQRGAFVLLAQGGALYNNVSKQMTDGNAYLGATFRALQEQQKSVGFQFDVLKNNVEAAAIGGFQKLSPEIAKTLGYLNGAGDSSSVFSQTLDASRPIIADVGELLDAMGQGLSTATGDVGPFVKALGQIGGTAVGAGLESTVGGLADIAQGVAGNTVLIDGFALLLVGKYASSLAAAAVQVVTLKGAEVSMAASTRLASVGLTAQSLAAEQAALHLAGTSDAALATRASLSGLAGFVNPLTLAVAGLGAIFLTYEQGQKSAKKAVDDLSAAMSQEGDAADRSTNAFGAAALAHGYFQKEIRKAGIDTQSVTDSLKGNKDAQDALTQSIASSSSPALQKNAQFHKLLGEAIAGNGKSAKQLQDIINHGNYNDADLGTFILKYASLSNTFTDASKQAGDTKTALEQLGSSTRGTSNDPLLLASSIKQLGTDSTLSEEALKELQQANDELQKSFEKWASPDSALKDALSDVKDQARAASSAVSGSSKDQLSAQRKALTESQAADRQALTDQKANISNRTKGSTDAINKELANLKVKQNAEKDDLDQQIKNAKTSKSTSKDVVDNATVDLDRYVAKLKEQDDALEKFQDNLVKIAGRYGTAVAKQLQDLGPDAATLIDQFANTTGKKADQARAEIERNLDLTSLSSNIDLAMSLASVAAGHGTDQIGIAAIQGLKGHTTELAKVAAQYAIDLTQVADPILDQLGLKKIDTNSIMGPVAKRGTIVVPKAEGGVTEQHHAEIAPGGAWRVWAEPETGGEAYIPLAESKAERSRDIWEKVGAMKGWSFGSFDAFADGGFNLPFPPGFKKIPVAQPAQYVVDGTYEALKKAIAANSEQSGAPGGPASAAPKGQIVDWIHAAEAIAGWPDSYTNGLYQLIMHESGGNPSAINLTDSNAKAGHACVPLDTKILTDRGWLSHDEVRTGDRTIGYNPATEQSEWTVITEVHHFDSAPVWEIGNKRWRARVTPNHRWWSDTTVSGGYRGEMVETRNLRSSTQRVRLAAWTQTEGIEGLSVQDAAVLGWLHGDGHLRLAFGKPHKCPECGWLPKRRKPSRGGEVKQTANSVAVHRSKMHRVTKEMTLEDELHGWDGSIYQSKPEMVIKLRALLANIPHVESHRYRNNQNTQTAYQFSLKREWVTGLMQRARLGDDELASVEMMVLAMSPEQRSAWLSAMIDAEGNRQAGKKPHHNEFVRIAQIDGPLQDAIRLAVYLEGWRPTYSANSAERNGYQPAGTVGMARPHVVPSMFADTEVLEDQAVWCVTTELGTWTMLQSKQVMLTGNSRGLMQTIPATFSNNAFPGHGNIFDPVDNILAGTRYALNRYGEQMVIAGGRRNAQGAYIGYANGGINTGTYDEGGDLKPGWTMAFNGTGQTEHIMTKTMVDSIVTAIKENRGGTSVLVQGDAESVTELARRVVRKTR